MNPLLQEYVQANHYEDLLREARNERLARQAVPYEPVIRKLVGKAFLWIGTRALTLGERLEPRSAASRESASSGAGVH